MPEFLEHLENVLNAYLKNRMSQENQLINEDFLKSLDQENKQIVTEFALDVFSFINTQLTSLSEKVQGELYIEMLRVSIILF